MVFAAASESVPVISIVYYKPTYNIGERSDPPEGCDRAHAPEDYMPSPEQIRQGAEGGSFLSLKWPSPSPFFSGVPIGMRGHRAIPEMLPDVFMRWLWPV